VMLFSKATRKTTDLHDVKGVYGRSQYRTARNYFLAISSSIGPMKVSRVCERIDLNPTRSMESAIYPWSNSVS